MKWYEIRAENLRPISIVIGGRGIGKTYSTISFLMESGEKFIYLRNTDVQLRESASDFGNPFKRWNLDHGRNIEIHPEGKHYIISENEEIVGYAAALSTFKNLRGVDLSDIRYVFFDEFIEREKIRFDQFSAFANMYETINRNRELLGEQPLYTILLSNAQKLDNPILAGYGFIGRIEKMMQTGRRLEKTKEYSIELPESEISEAKAETAMYKLAAGSRYAEEALRNEHRHVDVLVSGLFEITVKDALDVFPDGIAVGTVNEDTLDGRVVDQLCLLANVGEPLSKVDLHIGDLLNLFIFCHCIFILSVFFQFIT